MRLHSRPTLQTINSVAKLPFLALVVLLSACTSVSTRYEGGEIVLTNEVAEGVPAYGQYLKALITQVDASWHKSIPDYTERGVHRPTKGAVVIVKFVLRSDGHVSIVEVGGDASKRWSSCAVDAVSAGSRKPGGYGAWPAEMVEELGEQTELTFTFYY